MYSIFVFYYIDDFVYNNDTKIGQKVAFLTSLFKELLTK